MGFPPPREVGFANGEDEGSSVFVKACLTFCDSLFRGKSFPNRGNDGGAYDGDGNDGGGNDGDAYDGGGNDARQPIGPCARPASWSA